MFSIESKYVKKYCNVCNRYRKFKEGKVSYIFKKPLSLSIVYSKCGHQCKKIFEESNELFKILGLISNIEEYQKIYNQVSKNINQEFRLKK